MKNNKILIIDDNPAIIEAIDLILTTEKYEVYTMTQVENFIEEVKRIQPAVILLDLLLSGQSGAELGPLLKKDDETKDIPIIIISAHPSAEKAAGDIGANAFLAKPFEIADLLQLVEKYIKEA